MCTEKLYQSDICSQVLTCACCHSESIVCKKALRDTASGMTEPSRGCGKCSRHGTGRRVLCLCVWLASGPGGFQFAFQGFDLAPDGFEFGFLALEEGKGDAGFFFQPGGGEEVDVLALALVFAEVAELDQALFNQGAQAVVGLAQADAQLRGKLALAEAGVGLQVLEDLQAPGFRRGAGALFIFAWQIVRFGGGTRG